MNQIRIKCQDKTNESYHTLFYMCGMIQYEKYFNWQTRFIIQNISDTYIIKIIGDKQFF